MQDVFDRIVNTGNEPTRQDLADLFEVIGAPGEKRDEKLAAAQKLFEATGHRQTNSQGHSILDALDSFGGF